MTNLLDRWKKNAKVDEKELDGTFNVAGVSFEGRQDIIEKMEKSYLEKGKQAIVRLVPQPDNAMDSNAIMVLAEVEGEGFRHIGYVPRDINEDMLAILPFMENISVKSIGRPTTSNSLGVTVYYKVKDVQGNSN